MKITFNQKILLGIGLMSAIQSVGFSPSASAAPRRDVKDARRDVKEARKEVRQERKDLRRADTPGERRDARQEVRDAKRDLRDERRDLRDERRENRPGYRPGTVVRPGYGYRPGTVGRPGYTQGNNFRTLEGTVTNDLDGNDFNIRTYNGQIVRVLMPNGEPGSLSRGDLVRVSGTYSGNTFNARTATILNNR